MEWKKHFIATNYAKLTVKTDIYSREILKMKTVTLKFNEKLKECVMYIDGTISEAYTCDEGEVVLSVVKKLNFADVINMVIEYK